MPTPGGILSNSEPLSVEGLKRTILELESLGLNDPVVTEVYVSQSLWDDWKRKRIRVIDALLKWPKCIRVTVDPNLLQGSYLLKFSDGSAQFVPGRDVY